MFFNVLYHTFFKSSIYVESFEKYKHTHTKNFGILFSVKILKVDFLDNYISFYSNF